MIESLKAAAVVLGAIAGILASLGAIFGVIFAAYRWYLKQNQQDKDIEKINDEDIKSIKDELCLLTYGLLACLKGLAEQGCDGPVTDATVKLEKHLNQQAHK